MPRSPRADGRLDAAALRAMPLPSNVDDDKVTRGTTLVIGGSPHTLGAVLLAGVAALRVGAGRLQIATDAAAVTAVGVAVPEALVVSFGCRERLGELIPLADSIVVGPGLDTAETAAELFGLVIDGASPSAVIIVDALAIPAVAGARAALSSGGSRLLVTPNREELDDLAEQVNAADRSPRTVAAAARVTVATFDTVALADGRCWTDPSPVSGLGTSGAGDVLAGVAGGIGARCGDAARSACWATLLHRGAARRAASRIGPLGYLARELNDELPGVLAELTAPSAPVESAPRGRSAAADQR